jgi:hypothetical protein
MNTSLEPQLLCDTTYLQEIYDLRVAAYEESPQAQFINRTIYPNGWSDSLDEHEGSLHWVIFDKGAIIASARLTILQDIQEVREDVPEHLLPEDRPFAYWSRLVVHKDYRRTRSMMKLDSIRKAFILNDDNIKFAFTCVVPARGNSLLRLGFHYLDDIAYKWGGNEQNEGTLRIYVLTKDTAK